MIKCELLIDSNTIKFKDFEIEIDFEDQAFYIYSDTDYINGFSSLGDAIKFCMEYKK